MYVWSRTRRIAPARFLSVTDGDTFWFLVDTSFHGRVEWPFRLEGYDAWEKKDLLGPVAVMFAVDWFAYHTPHSSSRFPFLVFTSLTAREFERMTLGRFVADIQCEREGSYGPMLTAAGMVKSA